jgi:hypothetical protein
MTPTARYRMLGRYGAWANTRLYDAAARLIVWPVRRQNSIC